MDEHGKDDESLLLRMRQALARHMRAAIWFSIAYNLLLLISPLYMLQVYDRVLTSGSVDTLILLTLLAVGLYVVYAAADTGRKRVFALMGQRLGDELEAEIFARGMTPTGSGRNFERNVANLGKLQTIFSGGTVQLFFDLPFSPFFCLMVFLVHPLLGWITVVGALILAALAWRTERATGQLLGIAGRQEQAASGFVTGVARQNDVIAAMGMGQRMLARWHELRRVAGEAGLAAGAVANVYGGSSRSFRQMLQTLILGAAAWLVIRQEISSGAIIASSILSGRALSPIDLAIASWKPLLRARDAWREVCDYVAGTPRAEAVTPLDDPAARLVADNLVVRVPGATEALLAPISFTLEPGQILLVIGASGQGKTSLLRTLAAAWPPGGGAVTLGGRDMHSWDSVDRGRHVGYLAQQLDLLPGTVRQNIERFTGDAPEPAYAAARAVGAHDAILSLPDGYDTQVAPGVIAPGQRQLIGLARADYGAPALLLLDEPTASLDQGAVAALVAHLAALKARGRCAVVSTHDLRLLPCCDYLLMIEQRRPTVVAREAYENAVNRRKARGPALAVAP